MTNSTTLSTPKREAPWIGIGASGEWTDYMEALEAAKLDFTVYPEKTFCRVPMVPIGQIPGYPLGLGQMVSVRDVELPMVANVRDTDNQVLGVVSPQYGIVQNEDAFSLIEPFTQAGGTITNVGMTEQGLVFMVLRMRQKEFLGDVYDFDVMCCNSFNARFPLSLMLVPTRIICQNMYRGLLKNNDMLLRIRHMSKADERMKAAVAAVGMIDDMVACFGQQVDKASMKQLDNQGVWNMLEMLFPYPKPGGKHEQTSRAKVDLMREDFYNGCYLAPDNDKFVGTGMGFLNAYYDWLSHRDPAKNMAGSWADRRLSGLVSGNDVKHKLIERCM